MNCPRFCYNFFYSAIIENLYETTKFLTLQNKAEKIFWDIFLNMNKSNADFISYAFVATVKEGKTY